MNRFAAIRVILGRVPPPTPTASFEKPETTLIFSK
jgi:hypothetical protein